MTLLSRVFYRWPALVGLAVVLGAGLLAGSTALWLRHAHEQSPEGKLARVELGGSREQAESILGGPSDEKPHAVMQAADGRVFRGTAVVWQEGDCVTFVLYDEEGHVAYKDLHRQAPVPTLEQRLWFWLGW